MHKIHESTQMRGIIRRNRKAEIQREEEEERKKLLPKTDWNRGGELLLVTDPKSKGR